MQTNMETYFGYVKTPQDAIVLFEACRRGYLSRVQRRLSEKERAAVRSGSVFVWDEREAGMRRWTDGRTWSPSRVSGSFLTYRELDSKRRGSNVSRGSMDASSDDTDSSESYGNNPASASPPNSSGSSSSASSSSSSAKPSFSYKPDGLVKQSFSICTATHQKLHLICYYTKQDILNDRLKTPSQDDKLKNITIPKGMYPDTNALETSGGAAAALHHMHPYETTPPQHGRSIPPASNTRPAPYPSWPPSPASRMRTLSRNSSVESIVTSPRDHMRIDISPPTTSAFLHHPSSPPSLSSSPSSDDEDMLDVMPTPPSPMYHQPLQPLRSNARSSALPPLKTSASPRNNINMPHPHATPVTPVSPVSIACPIPYSFNIPSISGLVSPSGSMLLPQDIAWEKLRSSEDDRQLNAIYTALKL